MIENRVIEVISKTLNIPNEKINLSTGPNSLAEWDSLGHISIVSNLETEFGIYFPIDVIIELKNVSDIIQYLSTIVK